MAMGIEVDPTDICSRAAGNAGTKRPKNTPRPIAKKIQRVRYRSKNESFFSTELFCTYYLNYRIDYRIITIYDKYMALSRKEDFPEKDLQLAEWCKALSHPARIAILRNLANRGECICGDLVLDLPLAQSTVSQHLKALKLAGLVQGEVDGPRSRYCVHRKNFERFMKAFDVFGSRLSENLESENCD